VGLIGESCDEPNDRPFEVIRDLKIGDNVLKAVNLTDDEYRHRLVHGEMCEMRLAEEDDEEEVFHLHSVSLFLIL
jgi:hypothetical protein